MTDDRAWTDMAAKLRTSLADGIDVGGVTDQFDEMSCFGRVAFEVIIETSDLIGDVQADAYTVLCDLLATRLRQGADQVLGCMVFETEPEPAPLAKALDGMVRNDGRDTFTPVLALSLAQAEALAEAGLSIEPMIDSATDLIRIAADRQPPTTATAETLLAELDELVSRQVQR